MSEITLNTEVDHNEKICEKAYHLWISDGGPHVHNTQYWEKAQKMVEMNRLVVFPSIQVSAAAMNAAFSLNRQPASI